MAEAHLSGASIGPLVAAGYQAQFARARDGDRFWYENDSDFSPEEVAILRQTTLADIIRRNTGVMNIPDNVFFSMVPEPGTSALFTSLFLAFLQNIRRHRLRGRRLSRIGNYNQASRTTNAT